MLASNIPSKIQLPFASSGTKNTIPVPSQIGITPGAASYTDGFPPLTFTALTAGGIPPDGADVNGVLNAITAIQQWQSAGGHFKYDSAFSTAIGGYPQGAILLSSTLDIAWLNLADNNTTDPDSVSAANWVSLASYGIGAVAGLTNVNITLTPAQYAMNVITLAGTLTGNVQIIFPNSKRKWLVINNTTGAFTVTCKTAAGTGGTVSGGGGMQEFYGDGTNLVAVGWDGRYLLSSNYVVNRGYLAGCTMSTAGSSTTMSIAGGQAADSTNSVLLNVPAIAKTTAAWAVGTANGGLDTGAIANSTWYYFYLIRRPDTGVVDAIFSLSSSAPTLPANYTQYRYIGAGLTNGSGQWTSFTQKGREFYWSTPVQDFNGAGSATAALLTLSVPRGRKVKGAFNLFVANNTQGCYLSDPDNADVAPSTTSGVSPFSTFGFGSASFAGSVQAQCWTNTSAQIRHREANTAPVGVATLGWLDLADSQ